MGTKMMFKICLFFCICSVKSANILGVFHIPSISHQVVFQPLWKELSLRGHRVTIITPNPLNDPTLINLTEIDVSFTYPLVKNAQNDLSDNVPLLTMFIYFFELQDAIIEKIFEYPPVNQLIKDNTTNFDLVLYEVWSPVPLAFAAKYKSSCITMSSLGVSDITHDLMGNPTHPVLYPDIFLFIRGEFNWYYRLKSFLFNIWGKLVYKWYLLPKTNRLARRYFGKDIPYLGDLEKNVSLILENTNSMIHPIRPIVPKVIQMGQMHLKPKKTLPQDLQTILDDAKEGVVYFSLGSNVKSSNLPPHIIKTIVDALSELPYAVLWKWETDNFPGTANNVITRKWLPQQDVLGHPNVKVFVTQGGLQSSEEAIANTVPMVGIPFIGDQFLNVQKLKQLGIAVEIDYNDFTKDDLKNAIIEVAQNKKYKEKIEEVASILFDQPMTGLERAIWWIEYVLRHKGARHLRSPVLDTPFYQYYLLDVIGVLLLGIFVVIYSIVKVISLTKKLLFSSKKIKTT